MVYVANNQVAWFSCSQFFEVSFGLVRLSEVVLRIYSMYHRSQCYLITQG